MKDNKIVNDNIIDKLINLSHIFGEDIASIQGGGGNISAKFDNNIYIKASGIKLKDITSESIAILNIEKLKRYLDFSDEDDNTFSRKIKSLSLNNVTPSIETGFHGLINECFVAHTHSVYVNVLACSEEGKNILESEFKNSIFIEYGNPGVEVLNIYKHYLSNVNKSIDYIFLQNHGVITFSDSDTLLLDKYNFLINRVMKLFNLPNFELQNSFIDEMSYGNILFPDQAVYLDSHSSKSNITFVEVLSAYKYILSQINRIGFTAKFIPIEKVKQILNMDSEKYRKGLMDTR